MRTWPPRLISSLVLGAACAGARPQPDSVPESGEQCLERVTNELKTCLEDARPNAMARVGAGMTANPSATNANINAKAQRKANACHDNNQVELQRCALLEMKAERAAQVDGEAGSRACAQFCDFFLPRLEVCFQVSKGLLAPQRADCVEQWTRADPSGAQCQRKEDAQRPLTCDQFLRSNGFCVDQTDCHPGEICGSRHRCEPQAQEQ